jgi:tetratricopeptide (TPR) repeat protein
MPNDQSGGINLSADGDVGIGGDAVGRDKVINLTYITGLQPRRSELPHQPYFFGREEELARIADALDPQSAGWGVLIDGPGGIGKTALAIRAGHLAPNNYYPTKIFLSAKVRELTPQGEQRLEDFVLPNYMALLAELARELGEDEIAKLDPDERAQAVRRALEYRQALIIIDNLETLDEKERERLFQFLRRLPHSCKAIVTSRRRTDVAAEIIRLDRLTPEAALKLIAKLAERNRLLARASDQERRQLYEITHGNPLLIEWIVGQLGRHRSKCCTIHEAYMFIEAAPGDNDPLEYIFGDLLDTFTESETAILAALSHFAQPVRVQWVAELAGIAEPAVQTALEDLTDRALLISDAKAAAYLLPPLAATFLRRKCPEVIAQTGARLTDHVYALALENGFQEYERFAILEAEWPRIAAALPLFLSGESARLQHLYAALKTFLDIKGRLDEWLACAHRVEADWIAGASEIREKAIAERLNGVKYQLQENYSLAIAAYKESVDLWRAVTPESDEVAGGLNSLGEAERLAGDYDSAERDYAEALRIAEAVNDREGQVIYAGNLALLALEREDWITAESRARGGLLLADTVGRQDLIAGACLILAQSLARQNRPTEGLSHAERAVEIYAKLRSPNLEWAQAVLEECQGDSGSDSAP